ncbi:MAG TPA: endolytic transglycosylase MltG, partial [Castellaniella sp.]|nr:endolytic transglycosylase MltG [Castellaniella sp.]
TPIASPGKAALLATLHPDAHNYLYFVSRGDGTSEFSTNLSAHNRAVGKYILKRN